MSGRTQATVGGRGGRDQGGGHWWKALLIMVLIAGLLIAAGIFVLSKFTRLSIFNPAGCTASTAGGHQVGLALSQMQDAATIAAVGHRLGVPVYGVEIAEATAFQESKLENITYGDRDSVGLFQQRPSQGWGTAAEIMDPVYASTKFYDALLAVSGWQTMSLAQAAQAVQRSADGELYAEHQADATVLATVFTGSAGAGLTCTLDGPTFPPQTPGANGLTGQANAYSNAFKYQLGTLTIQNVSSAGSAFDVVVPGADTVSGWSFANWSVAQAEGLGVISVTYDGKIWSAAQGSSGWQAVTSGDPNAGEIQIEMTTNG